MEIKRILTIAGSDSGGGAGIQADLKTITVLGGFGMSVITALTAQNTLGVHAVQEVPPEFIAAQFDAVAADIGVDAAKTGMLPSAAVVEVVAEKIGHYGIKKLVVDPVMTAKGGAMLMDPAARAVLVKKLLPLALVVTPNIPEAEILTGVIITSVSDMKAAARIIFELGVPNVIVKGGHLPGDAVDVLYDGREFYEFPFVRIATKDTHGTGCTFSAALATGLARGKEIREAVTAAEAYMAAVIGAALRLGAGHGPVHHGFRPPPGSGIG
ncbi:MAG TPA: bifunctional hydroxymethylpyrimidine kinase/phosphomethylpyrimidine kinase [Syntrophales bacterium]|jgi:hydroxymethylpyrimidine/phosphomethylpyrimidine kinase|nr:bifunctional hydroxymethylpyrimidine kinase/phosphomethylpyrimidine kinase [Syntrophales bacterium]HON23149.1 bifunctional hydroxymethylpyrimidine kinase/phosphomethylpyrimidine kinase [Syntrophales bacterium]HOU76867.1 bifunctional hydroxymethylpyrimidine kinase/phosphomethylpyrimidine kinase [Syntrophales bacterium]HPC31636.1 bifunctional hydroxymethylpyrimidine kinase/phosphomethylpyrimidine kinase [Syntrophales bacterium]HQG35072.1 bifunctional hydroxymethylpyrimidine kinase/phosphomethy